MLKENGFTLLDFLVVLIIISMVIAMSIPAFSSYIRGTRLRTAAREISTAIMSARTQAITLREYRTVFFDTTKGDFGIVGGEEGWSLPPGVKFDAFPAGGITLTPLGKVSGTPTVSRSIIIFSDENNNNTLDTGEIQRTITVGTLGHVIIN